MKTMELSIGLQKYHNMQELPQQTVVSEVQMLGNGDYDLRKSIASEILGHTTSFDQSGRMPFFKEAYIRAKLEKGNVDTTGMDFQKALTTTLNTYSAGTLPVLIPVYVDPEIVDLTRRATPLVELIPRVTNYGLTADYNQITKISTAQFLPQDPAENEQDDTVVRKSVTIKSIYSIGRVTGQMFAASKQYLSAGGYVDALSYEVKNKTLAFKRLEEAAILLGDSLNNWTEPVNSTSITGVYSYDGLWNIISNANSIGLGGASTYTTDLNGAALSIANIRTAIRTARANGGEPNLIVTDLATYDTIKSLIQDEIRYISTQNIAWGIVTLSFEGIPVIASRFLSTTAGSGSATPYNGRSLFVLDTNVIEMRVLQDMSYEELAKTNDSIKFHIKGYEALVCKAPQFNFVIYDIGS